MMKAFSIPAPDINIESYSHGEGPLLFVGKVGKPSLRTLDSLRKSAFRLFRTIGAV